MRLLIRNSFFFITIAILFFSCTYGNDREIGVSSINNSILKWIPYQEQNIITFTNQKGEELSFKVTKKNIEDFEIETVQTNEKKAFLFGQLNENYNQESEFNYDYLIYIKQSADMVSSRVTYNILDCATEFDCFPLSVLKREVKGQKKEIIDSLIVGKNTYYKVVKLERDTTVSEMNNKNCRIWKMCIAPGYGIIEFYDRINNNRWVLRRD